MYTVIYTVGNKAWFINNISYTAGEPELCIRLLLINTLGFTEPWALGWELRRHRMTLKDYRYE